MWYPVVMTVLTGYLLGNLNGAVSMSALMAHDDVRGHGSGNAGLTNFARNYGGWGTMLVLTIDVVKTALACLVGGLLLEPFGLANEGRMLGAAAVTMGHDFPVLLGFRGGKGILCGITICACMDWRIAAIVAGVFLLAYLCSGIISLGSVLGAAAVCVCFILFYRDAPWVMAGGIVLSLLAIFMHRGNIARIFRGGEPRTNIFQKRRKQ